jgi:hypothetical protein
MPALHEVPTHPYGPGTLAAKARNTAGRIIFQEFSDIWDRKVDFGVVYSVEEEFRRGFELGTRLVAQEANTGNGVA